jgi:hypothetical protein
MNESLLTYMHTHIRMPVNKTTQGVTPTYSVPRIKVLKSSICSLRVKHSVILVLKTLSGREFQAAVQRYIVEFCFAVFRLKVFSFLGLQSCNT